MTYGSYYSPEWAKKLKYQKNMKKNRIGKIQIAYFSYFCWSKIDRGMGGGAPKAPPRLSTIKGLIPGCSRIRKSQPQSVPGGASRVLGCAPVSQGRPGRQSLPRNPRIGPRDPRAPRKWKVDTTIVTYGSYYSLEWTKKKYQNKNK